MGNDPALPTVAIGGSVFSGRYNVDRSTPVADILRAAFSCGINLIDTSPFYADSEKLIGEALGELQIPRDSYMLSTKVGRYGVKDFDYSSERMRASVMNSLRVLGVAHLDFVFLHDVEFMADDMILDHALPELFKLKAEGEIRWIGISGYPLPKLLHILQTQHDRGQPLDAVLSYCHLNLQNTLLAEYAAKFRATGIRYLFDASPLSMGLLRDVEPPAWHPAPLQLRQCVADGAKRLKEKGIDIGELAVKYALTMGKKIGVDSTVIGMAQLADVEAARPFMRSGAIGLSQDEEDAVDRFQKALGKEWLNWSWPSP